MPRTVSKEEIRILETLAQAIETQLELRQLVHEQRKLFEERAILTDMIMHDASGIVATLRWGFTLLEKEIGDESVTLIQCQKAGDELLRLCESVLNTNDDHSRALTVERELEALRPWFDSLGRRAERMQGDAEITIELVNELPEQPIDTDVHLLERIIVNLVRNAIQACSSGSKVVISGRSEKSALVFSVADNGPGVPGELVDRLFEPYVSSRRSGPQGAGLGLSICRLAARALGGSIEYLPRERGTEFVVVVPTEQKEKSAAVG